MLWLPLIVPLFHICFLFVSPFNIMSVQVTKKPLKLNMRSCQNIFHVLTDFTQQSNNSFAIPSTVNQTESAVCYSVQRCLNEGNPFPSLELNRT